jgi:hypothetical protein
LAPRLLRFLLKADGTAVRTELDHAVTLGIAHLITENAGAAGKGESVAKEVEFSVENVVAEN